MLIHGACHCGNIAFDLHWEPDPAQIPARACTCSFCIGHGGIWTSFPSARLRVQVRQPSLVSHYTFGTQTAEFHVCSRCGVVPVVTAAMDDNLYAVVNVNTFEEAARALVQQSPITFDDEDPATRLARRKRNWIADVGFAGGQI